MASHTPKRAARTKPAAKPFVSIIKHEPPLTSDEHEFLKLYVDTLVRRGCGSTVSIGNLTLQRAEELINTKLIKTPVPARELNGGASLVDRLANQLHFTESAGLGIATAAQNGGQVGAIPGAACGLSKVIIPPLLEASDRLGQLQSELKLLSEYAADRLGPILPIGFSAMPPAAPTPQAPSDASPAVQRLQDIAAQMSVSIDSIRSLLRNAQI